MRAVITGAGHFVPEQRLTNKDLERMVDTNDEWITSRTGIKERRILEKGKGTSYMATKAAEMVLEQKGMSPDELDMIIVGTFTPDMPLPSTAALVQDKLGAKNCWGFDLNGGCSGFLFALATASQFIETGKHEKILVIGGDTMNAVLNYEDRNTCVLFGDGAGAVLVEPSEDRAGVEDFLLRLDGSGGKHLNVPAGGSAMPATHETVDEKKHYVHQEGRAVFKNAVMGMTDVSLRILKKNGLTAKDVDLLIPHQANIRIIDSISRKLELEPEQVVINIHKYGNTTAGTIPIALSEAYQEKRMSKGDRILLSAFGAGFAWGSMLIEWAMD